MSEKHSKALPPLSPAGIDLTSLDAALGEVTELFSRHRLFGLTWIDTDLIAVNSYGALADFIPIGQRITETVSPLTGLDDALHELKATPDDPFQMPNVALVGPDGESPRLNLVIYWLPMRRQFVLLISRVQSTGDLEIGLAQQVRGRMIAEAELAQKSKALAAANTDLTRANRDLAEFAYVISHDLKAPLRAMRYFTDDLDRALNDAAAGDPREYAGQIRKQSRRMSQMLTDLLTYSKIGRQTEAFGTVDTREMAHSIVASMPAPAGMQIAVSGDWPLIETYAAPLDLVLRNLIGNAISHHDRAKGKISISAQPAATTLTIEIADDGPGIAPEWHEAIFQPFKTAGADHTGEHSGIGLALVRRAAETAGATITLTSDPAIARGTTFRVNWPLVLKP
jgi:signal transduction histidine kinase